MELIYYEHDYEAEKPKILLEGGDRFTVRCKPEATVLGFVTLVDGDETYKLDATFDFSKVPARWHSLALQMALGCGRSRMHLPIGY
jgi:hypothetical protein